MFVLTLLPFLTIGIYLYVRKTTPKLIINHATITLCDYSTKNLYDLDVCESDIKYIEIVYAQGTQGTQQYKLRTTNTNTARDFISQLDNCTVSKPWIVNAWMKTKYLEEYNVTDKLLEFAGPEGNFHDQLVDFSLFFQDGDRLYIQDSKYIVFTIDLEHNQELVDIKEESITQIHNINIAEQVVSI